eukprot:2991614-Pleurochrysis_carterae.AAC.2
MIEARAGQKSSTDRLKTSQQLTLQRWQCDDEGADGDGEDRAGVDSADNGEHDAWSGGNQIVRGDGAIGEVVLVVAVGVASFDGERTTNLRTRSQKIKAPKSATNSLICCNTKLLKEQSGEYKCITQQSWSTSISFGSMKRVAKVNASRD